VTRRERDTHTHTHKKERTHTQERETMRKSLTKDKAKELCLRGCLDGFLAVVVHLLNLVELAAEHLHTTGCEVRTRVRTRRLTFKHTAMCGDRLKVSAQTRSERERERERV
jgi:hypothetical protein